MNLDSDNFVHFNEKKLLKNTLYFLDPKTVRARQNIYLSVNRKNLVKRYQINKKLFLLL